MTGIRVHHLNCAHLRLRLLTAGHPEIDVFCAHDPAPLASPSPRPAAPTQQP